MALLGATRLRNFRLCRHGSHRTRGKGSAVCLTISFVCVGRSRAKTRPRTDLGRAGGRLARAGLRRTERRNRALLQDGGQVRIFIEGMKLR